MTSYWETSSERLIFLAASFSSSEIVGNSLETRGHFGWGAA